MGWKREVDVMVWVGRGSGCDGVGWKREVDVMAWVGRGRWM